MTRGTPDSHSARRTGPPCLLGALEKATAHEARQDQGADDGNGQGTQVLPAEFLSMAI